VITRKQVADLQPGDTVNVRRRDWPAATTGELWLDQHGNLMHGGCTVRDSDGNPGTYLLEFSVIARAPRPLYANHPRTEPVAGDVVRDEDGDLWTLVDRSAYGELRAWHWSTAAGKWVHNSPQAIAGGTLLVDGETGTVVPQ